MLEGLIRTRMRTWLRSADQDEVLNWLDRMVVDELSTDQLIALDGHLQRHLAHRAADPVEPVGMMMPVLDVLKWLDGGRT